VKTYGHCGYQSIAARLGVEEDSWPLVKIDLFKEVG